MKTLPKQDAGYMSIITAHASMLEHTDIPRSADELLQPNIIPCTPHSYHASGVHNMPNYAEFLGCIHHVVKLLQYYQASIKLMIK